MKLRDKMATAYAFGLVLLLIAVLFPWLIVGGLVLIGLGTVGFFAYKWFSQK